jgi:cytochrome c
MKITPKSLVIAFFAFIIGAMIWGSLTQRGSVFDKSQSDNGPRSPQSGKMTYGARGDPPIAFTQCATCHSMEPAFTHQEEAQSGPTLSGIYGARSGKLAYAYSPALVKAFPIWDAALLDRFIANPQATIPGTTMRYAGEPNAAKRAAIIAYLKLNSAQSDAQ